MERPKTRHSERHRSDRKTSPSRLPRSKSVPPSAMHMFRLDKQASNKYCWVCHSTVDGNNITCIRCPRLFHRTCLPSQKTVTRTCHVCLALESVERVPKFSKAELKVLLNYILTVLEDFPWMDPLIEKLPASLADAVDNPMTMEKIKQNVNNQYYRSPESFLADLDWIVHDCFKLTTLRSFRSAAEKMMQFCKEEVYQMLTCTDCFHRFHLNQQDWFTAICKRPHIPLMVKVKGFPYWPAKELGMKNGLVYVQFFGKHDCSLEPPHCCLLLTDFDPNKRIKGPFKVAIREAMIEAKIYIEGLEKKFGGHFQYLNREEFFDPEKRNDIWRRILPKTEVTKEVEESSQVKKRKSTLSGEQLDESTPKSKKTLENEIEFTPTLSIPNLASPNVTMNQTLNISRPKQTSMFETSQTEEFSTTHTSPQMVLNIPYRELIQNGVKKVSDVLSSTLEETLNHVMASRDLIIKRQRCEIEEMKRQMLEQKRESDIKIEEIQIQATKAIEEAKSAQWCSYCRQPASLFCCWNTSYCSNECQQQHWTIHYQYHINNN